MCGLGCAVSNERDRDEYCVDCSYQIASRDLDALAKYKQNITIASEAKCFPASLLAAFISRQTMAGAELDGTNGWINCHNTDNQFMCFGLMHTNQSKIYVY